eukprot:COSAG02_NODE_4588_length_5186_cov_12.818361_3_plen_113_part_00
MRISDQKTRQSYLFKRNLNFKEQVSTNLLRICSDGKQTHKSLQDRSPAICTCTVWRYTYDWQFPIQAFHAGFYTGFSDDSLQKPVELEAVTAARYFPVRSPYQPDGQPGAWP